MLSCLNELMSINILYPGLLGTCFCFVFGTFACLIFTCVHTSHSSRFPVFLSPYFQLCFLGDAPQCVQLFDGIFILEYFFHVLYICVFIPINHDDPDGIILSNFILAFVVLNSSIIRPPSFDLPFICHPYFMALVKLKSSWCN